MPMRSPPPGAVSIRPGSEEDGGALTAKVWKDGTELYAYSVSPATSQAKAIAATAATYLPPAA